jgi:hypothetical protein
MSERQISELESLIDNMDRSGHPPDTFALTNLSLALSKMFNVAPDEVAILALNMKEKNLNFVIPEKLAGIGTIPLSNSTALASRTARENRADVMNNFSMTRHATVFEGVPLGRKPGESIQKIVSAPIVDGKIVQGVVQISRKGYSQSDAGPDFTQQDLRALISLNPVLQRFLKLCQTS